MNSARFVHWSRLHERRARGSRAGGGWWSSPVVLAVLAGAAIAGWVAWRDVGQGLAAASHTWLAVVVVAFAVAFIRVPFHLYWRQDAALLAQLPIEGGPLFDAALLRCVRAALATTAAAVLGALPIALRDPELFARHAAVAGALGATAAMLMPAVATFAASLVALGQRDARMQQLSVRAGIAKDTDTPAAPSSAMLGALPGFAGTIVIVGIVLVSRWLTGGTPVLPAVAVLGTLAGASVLALLGVRAVAPRVMGTILRDVSALDRQRLAHLEIRPPTAIERAIAGAIGEAALPYRKDARLVRRRYPMAFALGALAFVVLVVVGLARPDDPGPWLVATFAGAAVYGIVLAGRLARPPIELPRLSRTLPISAGARARAKLAWLLGWWTTFVAAPGVFAVLRQADPPPNLMLLAGATVALVVASVATRRARN